MRIRWIAAMVAVALAGTSLSAVSLASTSGSPTLTTIMGGAQSGPARSVGMLPVAVRFIGGDLFVVDSSFGAVRQVDTASGAMTVVEGDYPASARSTTAQHRQVRGDAVAGAANGEIIVVDQLSISARSADGSVHVIAGGPTSQTFNSLTDVLTRPDGTLLVIDANRIRAVDSGGVVHTVGGGGTRSGASADGHPASEAALGRLGQIALGSDGAIFTDEVDQGTIRRIGPDGVISTIATNLQTPTGLAIDNQGHPLVSETIAHQVVRIENDGSRTPIAGTGVPGTSGDGGPAARATLQWPGKLALDPVSDTLAIADPGSNLVRAVLANGSMQTVAGSGSPAFNGDGAAATATQVSRPEGVAVDSAGRVYVADALDHRVRRIETDGRATTIAGDGTAGFGGDEGLATAAQLMRPTGLAFDNGGNLYIADEDAGRVRRVGRDGRITTVAGGGSSTSDGPSATDVALQSPVAVAVGPIGDVYIAEYTGHRVRAVVPGGAIVTVAGTGTAGYSGDGGPAVHAKLDHPAGVAVDWFGTLYIADFYNGRVRTVGPAGLIATYLDKSGTAEKPYGAIGTGVDGPYGITVDPSDHVVVTSADTGRVVRVLDDGSVELVAGCCNPSVGGDSGPATATPLGFVTSVAVDGSGRVVIADPWSNRVKAVTGAPLPSSGPTPLQQACDRTDSDPAAFADAGLAADCLKAYGIALGKLDGTFGEGDPLLRSQVSSLLARLVTTNGLALDERRSFPDVNAYTVPDQRVRAEIEALAGAGIILGLPDGSFGPAQHLSVAQATAFVVRALQYVHDHRPSAPGIRDLGSTTADYDYAASIGVVDFDAADVTGARYGNGPTDTAQRGLLADMLAHGLGKLGKVYFVSCAEAGDAGAAPLRLGDAGYRAELDADGDGVACSLGG